MTVKNSKISGDITVKELLTKYPHLLHMFLDMELQCVGCPAEAFHSLAEVAQEYDLDLDKLLRQLNRNIKK